MHCDDTMYATCTRPPKNRKYETREFDKVAPLPYLGDEEGREAWTVWGRMP